MGEINTSLANLFIRYAFSTVSEHRNRELAMLSTADFMSIQTQDRDIAWLGHCIKRCPSYRLDQGVVDAGASLGKRYLSDEVEYKKFITALGKSPQLYAVPFPVMWLEWEVKDADSKNPNLKNGLVLENLPTGGSENTEDGRTGIKVTLFSWQSDGAMIFPSIQDPICIAYGTPENVRTLRRYGKESLALSEEIDARWGTMSRGFFNIALILLTILKSRSNVLKLIPPTPSRGQKTIAKRIKKGKFVEKPLGVLTFDLARTLAKGRAIDTEDARRFMAEQIVMGHPKLREVRKRDAAGNKLPGYEYQLIWWSNHWRGGTEEQKLARKDQPAIKGREARTVISDPSRPRIIPWVDVSPKAKA